MASAARATRVLKRYASTVTTNAHPSPPLPPSSTPIFFGKIKKIPIKYPFLFGIVISTTKTSFADLLVQKVVEQKKEIDWRRNLAFASFGFFYLGGVQYGLYVKVFSRMFPNAAKFAAKPIREKLKDAQGIKNVISQAFIDQCVHHPLLYFPVFYCTKELVTSPEHPDFKRCLMEYKNNMQEDLLALWKVWMPTTLLNFAFMPMWARIPWVAGTSLVWTCILSTMRGGNPVLSDDLMGGGMVSGATMQIFNEGLEDYYACPIELDPTLFHACVSASGVDQVGWVATIAEKVAEAGGNVTNSRMVRMGTEFVILMHVSTKPENRKRLVQSLNDANELKPLNVRVSGLTRRETMQRYKEVGITVHMVGEDKPGMLAAIARDLSDHGLSVETLTTELRLSREGKREFVINAECVGKERMEQVELDSMVSKLSDVKSHFGFDVFDIRVHH